MDVERFGNVFPARDFHISKNIREKYNLKDYLFQLSGETLLLDFTLIRELTA